MIPLFLLGASAHAAVSGNTGSLGAAADATDANTVTSGPGAVTAGGDKSAVYDGLSGTSSSIPFVSQLNPASGSPFTIEFWARPTNSDNDDAPVSNRVATTPNRSGWVFFQRAAATGWNFRTYNGNGSTVGWDLTGGTSTLNAWSHVVATWDGGAAQLYVNGVLADGTNDTTAGGYVANTSGSFIVAASDTSSPYTGSVDEVAFYPSVLTPAKILGHFNAASSPTPNTYFQLIRSDGALLQLSNNVPEPSAMLMLGAGGLVLLRRSRAR